MSTPPDTDCGSGLAAVRSAVDEAGAIGFLQVDRGRTPSRRYLTRQQGPDRETAVLFCPGDDSQPPEAIYCVPNDVAAVAEPPTAADDSVGWQIVGRPPTTPTGQQVQALLADRVGEPGDRPLLVPRDLPHDTAVFLQEAGYTLQSTAAVRTARATKTQAERDCLTAVQAAAADGMARAETVLAASDHDDGLVFEGRPLAGDQLRRAINTELASLGVSPADNTRITVPTVGPTDQLPQGEPICIQLAPRGPQGYHAHLTRTFVVNSDGGWERRAAVAAEAGLRAAARQIEPGVDVSTVEGETVAEIGAYGFAVAAETDNSQARATATVHGVGLSTHEQPAPGTQSTLQAGSVIAIEASVVDPTAGAIRLGTLRAVTEEGSVRLASFPVSLTPTERPASADSDRT